MSNTKIYHDSNLVRLNPQLCFSSGWSWYQLPFVKFTSEAFLNTSRNSLGVKISWKRCFQLFVGFMDAAISKQKNGSTIHLWSRHHHEWSQLCAFTIWRCWSIFLVSWNSLVVWDGWLTLFIVCPMMAGSYKMTPGFGVGTGCGVHAVEKTSQGIGIDMYGLFVLVPYTQKSEEWTADNIAIGGKVGLNEEWDVRNFVWFLGVYWFVTFNFFHLPLIKNRGFGDEGHICRVFSGDDVISRGQKWIEWLTVNGPWTLGQEAIWSYPPGFDMF